MYFASGIIGLKIPRKKVELQPIQSWSKLLLWQPPITKLWITLSSALLPDSGPVSNAPSVNGIVYCETGLTIGMVLEAGRKFVENSPDFGYHRKVTFTSYYYNDGKKDCLAFPNPHVMCVETARRPPMLFEYKCGKLHLH